MKIIGKILFYNADTGQGMIITAQKEKINFSVADWDDFDTMPSLGLEVRFMYEDSIISSIVSMSYVEEQENLELSEKVEPVDQDIDTKEESLVESEEEQVNVNSEKDLDTEESVNSIEPSLDDSDEQEEDVNEEVLEKEIPEKALEHFETDKDILLLGNKEDIEEEIGPREESLTVTLNLSKAVENYFNIIDENVQRRLKYKKVDGRLDYLLIRRFLWTTYNNLSEIDLRIVTPKIKTLSDDLRSMATLYNDFMRKTKYPPLAYEEVFLSCQAEYKKIREGAEKTIQRLNQLKGSEQYLGSALKVKKAELSKEIDTEEFDLLQHELKSLNGTYVDIVHMMAELDERYKYDMKLLTDFEREYREDFYGLFNTSAQKYKKDIVDILSAQAFILDAQLWNQAKTSKILKSHFHAADIHGEFNTSTYLKYYLSTQDSTKSNEESKKLFELYDYLLSIQKEHIMIVLNDANDAMEFESIINRADKSYFAKAFIDEKASLKWAIKNSIRVLILESVLSKMQVESYLTYYQKYVMVIPKIILLGETKKSDSYAIEKLLPRGVSGIAIAKNVKEILSANKST